MPNPRFPGVEPRHARECPATGWNMDRCTCSPTYRGTAWSRKDGRLLKSPPFASAYCGQELGPRRQGRPPPRCPPRTGADDRPTAGRHLARAPRRRPRSHPLRPPLQALNASRLPAGHRRLDRSRAGPVPARRARPRRGPGHDRAHALRRRRRRAAQEVGINSPKRHHGPARDVAPPAARKSQPGNPMDGLALPASPKGRDRYATPVEAATLLAVLPRADQAIWGTALYAGLRRGELMGLRTVDVDVATGVIRVEQAYDPRSKKIIPPKSYAGRRKVPVAGLIRDTLIDARARASDRTSSSSSAATTAGRSPTTASSTAPNESGHSMVSTRSDCTSAATPSRR